MRGEEVPLMVFHGLMEYFDEVKAQHLPHVVIPVLGWFKNEVGERYFLLTFCCHD